MRTRAEVTACHTPITFYLSASCHPLGAPPPRFAGFFALPDVDTGVWIEFEAGNPSFPIWTGCFWNQDDIPSEDSGADIKFFRTKKFKLRIDDSVGEITIENDSGSQIVLNATEVHVKSSSVINEATGGKKTELSAVGLSVNDGALEVL